MEKKIKLGGITAVIILFFMWLSPALTQDLYLANGSSPTKLYKVDLGTNYATYLMDFTLGTKTTHAIAVTVDGNELVAIDRNGTAVIHVDLTCDPPSETKIGNLPSTLSGKVVQASFDLDGVLYFTDRAGNKLYTLDISVPNNPTLIGTVSGVDVEGADIAFDHDNTLYMLNNTDYRLYIVDTFDASVTLIGGVSTPTTNTGLAFTPDGRLVVSCNDDHLYEVSTFDASITDLGTLTIESTGSRLDIDSGDMARVSWVMQVEIDIKPGSDPNSINLGDHGLLPVAILGSPEFDVTEINPATVGIEGVTLAERGSPKAPKLAYSYEDADGDGYLDMMTFFDVQTLVDFGVLDVSTTALTITATLYDGTPIEGTDSVNIVH